MRLDWASRRGLRWCLTTSNLQVPGIKVALGRDSVWLIDDRSYLICLSPYRGMESRYDRICDASTAPCEVWGALGWGQSYVYGWCKLMQACSCFVWLVIKSWWWVCRKSVDWHFFSSTGQVFVPKRKRWTYDSWGVVADMSVPFHGTKNMQGFAIYFL